MRIVLKSKIHRATVTESNPDYEGSIGISKDLLEKADIWVGEKVLVISNDSGKRLETYAFEEKNGSGKISINGGAAKKINEGENITILSFKVTDEKEEPNKIIVDENNDFKRFL